MLRKLIPMLVLLCTGAVVAATSAPEEPVRGDPEAGEAAALTCIACHGRDGVGIAPDYPNLGGQHESYLVKQTMAFRDGSRYAVLMTGQVDHLSDEEIRNISAFYAQQPLAGGVADASEEDLALGERIYRAGLVDKGVAACIACHSPRGLGNGPAAYPVLSGQHGRYTEIQLTAYREGTRETDADMGGVMRGVAQNMNDREIEAVAAYIRALH